MDFFRFEYKNREAEDFYADDIYVQGYPYELALLFIAKVLQPVHVYAFKKDGMGLIYNLEKIM